MLLCIIYDGINLASRPALIKIGIESFSRKHKSNCFQCQCFAFPLLWPVVTVYMDVDEGKMGGGGVLYIGIHKHDKYHIQYLGWTISWDIYF